jgi:hypothetical protein
MLFGAVHGLNFSDTKSTECRFRARGFLISQMHRKRTSVKSDSLISISPAKSSFFLVMRMTTSGPQQPVRAGFSLASVGLW